MRINAYVARATGLSRRAADKAISSGTITVNGLVASPGESVSNNDVVRQKGQILQLKKYTLVMLNKPVGFVCSRTGQSNKTIYELLPPELAHLKPIGRLDKNSSGLLLLTNDGELAHTLTHPKYGKQKVYIIVLDKPLNPIDKQTIETGVPLDDGTSKLKLKGKEKKWTVIMSEGRNRQIRRTFSKLGYNVDSLHRVQFGSYRLGRLGNGKFINL